MATDDRPYQARRLRQSTRSTPLTIGRHSSTAVHSRKKVVGYFLGEIPSRKNLKEWRYLFDKIGRFWQKSSADACEGWSREPSPPTQLDSMLCKAHLVAALTGASPFLTLDGALQCPRTFYTDLDDLICKS